MTQKQPDIHTPYHIVWAVALPAEKNILQPLLPGIHMCVTGVWIEKTIMSLTQYCMTHHVDAIINIGVCGFASRWEWEENSGWKSERISPNTIPSIVQIIRTIHTWRQKELIIPSPQIHNIPLETCYCASRPFRHIPKTVSAHEMASFYDMESRWVEYVADQLNIPRWIYKIPTDRVGDDLAWFDKKKALTALESAYDYSRIIETIQDILPPKTQFFSHIRQTHTQSRQIAFLVQALSALGETDIENKTPDTEKTDAKVLITYLQKRWETKRSVE